MARKTANQTDVDRWLASIAPSDLVDASDLAALSRAVDERDRLNTEIARLVAVARANGKSWTTIGLALQMTRQAAQQRYGGSGGDARRTASKRRAKKAATRTTKVTAVRAAKATPKKAAAKKAAAKRSQQSEPAAASGRRPTRRGA